MKTNKLQKNPNKYQSVKGRSPTTRQWRQETSSDAVGQVKRGKRAENGVMFNIT